MEEFRKIENIIHSSDGWSVEPSMHASYIYKDTAYRVILGGELMTEKGGEVYTVLYTDEMYDLSTREVISSTLKQRLAVANKIRIAYEAFGEKIVVR